MKQTTVNEFKDGLNLDLHPLVTPKTVLTDNINGTFITYNGNEFCLQNDRGNKKVAELTPGYTPIGVKEHNGILYIVSVKNVGTQQEPDWRTEIGTFPSLENTATLNDEDFYEIELDFDKEDVYIEQTDSWIRAYKPLKIGEGHSDFTNVDLGYDIKHPVTIEIQDSYDGSVNIILVADGKSTKIINSGFSKLTDNAGKWIKRSQTVDTNIYHLTDENKLNQEINLIRTSTIITNIDLLGVQSGGQFKGGNYTFYIKFGDADYNQTDVVAESGVVSIFNGNDGVPSTISGTLLDERTDKMVQLKITGLNSIYSKLYVYFTREYSDTQGYRMTECGRLKEPIDIKAENPEAEDKDKIQYIWITGFEQQSEVNIEELNVDYHTIDWAIAEAQHSNMLFLGNIGQKETFDLYHKLENFTLDPENVTYNIGQGLMYETVKQQDAGGDSFSDRNYYSTTNIYYSLGYWPNELYRFGIVYILNDGSTTPVFNMTGNINNNNKGVFKTPDLDVLSTNNPIYFKFELHNTNKLDSRIIGWFVVRQKRIPITICQGINIGIDKRSYLPLIWDGTDWVIESFLSADRSKSEGEPYARDGNSRKIINVSSTHILRPFIEIFDASTTAIGNVKYIVGKTSLATISANKIIYDTYTDWKTHSIEAFENMTSPSHQYDENNDIIVEQDFLESYYTQGDKNLHLTVFAITDIKNDNNEYIHQTTNMFLYYFYYGSISSQLIETQNVNFYRGDKNDIIENINRDKYDYRFIKEGIDKISNESSGILSLDPCVNPTISSVFDGSAFNIVSEYSLTCERSNNLFDYTTPEKIISTDIESFDEKCVFVNENTKSKVISENAIFSNLAGSGTSAKQFERTQTVFGVKTGGNGEPDIYLLDSRVNEDYGLEDYRGYNSTHNINLIRGLFTPYLGVSTLLSNDSVNLYSLKRQYNQNEEIVREQDNSEYYRISKRQYLDNTSIIVYGGDCYICKVGLRILRNFIDSTAPIATTIVDPLGWENYVRQRSLYGGDTNDRINGGNDIDHKAEIADYSEVNLSDLNAVDLGYWVTFPCLSSYNLGLRSLDTFHTDEMSLLGSPRSFYPLSGASATNKVGDSYLLNDGLSATVGRKRYKLMPDVPYSKSEFANRIIFSNVNVTDAYTNGYRTFQGASFKDYDKQYGAITKLVSLGQNIFIVMEHGLGLVSVNPKALIQTTTGENVHIYGYGVLPDEMTVISQDYGSKYEHSVIRTPIGIYGIDVDAKKIWVFSDKQGFKTISDMHIETYLKDNLEPVDIEMGRVDIRTHYNAEKGDLMFTWDKINNVTNQTELYSICYNERFNTWVTRYDWKPIVSDNINDEFYSLNKRYNEPDGKCYIWDHKFDVAFNNGHVSSWYDNTNGFEFEFVVSDPVGVNKIFDNLQIISNNVQPDEMEITVIGDDYVFKRQAVDLTPKHKERAEYGDVSQIHTTSDIHGNLELEQIETVHSPKGYYHFDTRLNQSALTKWQPFKDMYKFGRRIGNIQYKEGSWFAQIEPLLITDERLVAKEARIRDKWAKIRIRYSGKDLAVITAIKTLINI